MKIIQTLAVPLIIGSLAVSFYGCNYRTSSPSPQSPTTDVQMSVATDDDILSTYVARIEHYESLIKELEEDLLYEKEENFIRLAEYDLAIKELKDALAALEEGTTSTPPSGNGLQSSPDKEPESNPPSNLATSSPYEVQLRDGSLIITAYRGKEREVTIPSQIGGIPVTAIGEGAFKDSNVAKVVIPDSVLEIDWFAFSDCGELFEITLPSSVTSIGYGAFDNHSPSLVIRCQRDSYAARFAASWGITFVCN